MKAAFEYTCICIELNDMNGKLKQIYSIMRARKNVAALICNAD